MSKTYTDEQMEIVEKIKMLRAELDKSEDKIITTDMFVKTVRKYTRAKKLTAEMLHELIDKIEVHDTEKINGETIQRLTIHYNCVGNIEIPNLQKLPDINVTVNTRQGVNVTYSNTSKTA